MSDLNLKINENCVHCGKCLNDCIGRVLEFDENNVPYAAHPERCIQCQHCLAICPVGALSILGKSPENSEPVKEHNPDEILNLIKSRRSFRHYKAENISFEVMNRLKNMLNWVPTGINFHKLHFAFVDDIEVMNDIRDYTNKKVLNAFEKPFVNSVLKKFERYKKAILSGQDVIYRGAPHMVVVSTPVNAPCRDVDPMIALSYFELYAQSLGLGTCWCGFGYAILNLFPELCKQLEIPAGYKVSYVMLFGNSDDKYSRATQPEVFPITSVKKGGRDMSLVEKIKRIFWNTRK